LPCEGRFRQESRSISFGVSIVSVEIKYIELQSI